MGRGRVAFMAKQWDEAEKRYVQVAERYPDALCTPEALYWRAVCHYKATNDHTVLGQVAEELSRKYPHSVWTLKASVFSH